MEWEFLLHNWEVKLVAVTLIVAAWIDGKELRVPNWITFPMALSGLLYHACSTGWGDAESGLAGALAGMGVGLLTLLPLYAVGGMGAGDVKLMGCMRWIRTASWSVCVPVTERFSGSAATSKNSVAG